MRNFKIFSDNANRILDIAYKLSLCGCSLDCASGGATYHMEKKLGQFEY